MQKHNCKVGNMTGELEGQSSTPGIVDGAWVANHQVNELDEESIDLSVSLSAKNASNVSLSAAVWVPPEELAAACTKPIESHRRPSSIVQALGKGRAKIPIPLKETILEGVTHGD